MASVLTALTRLGSYHLIAWGSLLGTQLYQVRQSWDSRVRVLITYCAWQTFAMTKLCYLYLPRAQFMTLQRKVFPVYFAIETALAVVTAVTYPGGSIIALSSNSVDSALLGIALGTSTLNLLVYGPKTSVALTNRNHAGNQGQEKACCTRRS